MMVIISPSFPLIVPGSNSLNYLSRRAWGWQWWGCRTTVPERWSTKHWAPLLQGFLSVRGRKSWNTKKKKKKGGRESKVNWGIQQEGKWLSESPVGLKSVSGWIFTCPPGKSDTASRFCSWLFLAARTNPIQSGTGQPDSSTNSPRNKRI